MMLRGRRMIGLVSRAVRAKGFSTEIFVSRIVIHGRCTLVGFHGPQVHIHQTKTSGIVIGLSFYTTEEELKNVFSSFGAVEEARLVRDNQTGRPKGFGFVKYSSQEEAHKAVDAMDGRILRGRLIFAEIAKERNTG